MLKKPFRIVLTTIITRTLWASHKEKQLFSTFPFRKIPYKTSGYCKPSFCCPTRSGAVLPQTQTSIPYQTMSSSESEPPPLISDFRGTHRKCRNGTYPRSSPPVQRLSVPDEKVDWKTSWADYSPPDYTDPKTIGAVWADPNLDDPKFAPAWNSMDGTIDRTSHIGAYKIDDGRPQNPKGRTGLKGRGHLGKWGPNHAADPIVTRWKRDSSGIVKNSRTGLPILQAVCILRRDCGEWAIPGGMVDAGEVVSATLKREFGEETMSTFEMTEKGRKDFELRIENLFANGLLVYKGYVDDQRNTDNSWMETVAMNFHDESGDTVGSLNFKAGDDATGVQWTDLDEKLELYASHNQFIEAAVRSHKAHW